MKKTAHILFPIFLIMIGIQAYAQSTVFIPSTTFFRMNLGDMRAKGMGNTEVLSTSGSNATFYNPSLLTNVTSFQVQVNGKMGFSGEESSSGSDAKYDVNSDSDNKISGFSIANSWTHEEFYRVGYGLGILLQHDFSLTRDISQQWTQGDNRYNIDESYNGNGGITTFCPSLAVGFGDFLFIGVAGNAAVSSDFDEEYSRDSRYTRPSDGYSYESNYGRTQNGYLRGAGYVAALRIKILRLQAGVVYRSKLRYNFRDITYENTYSGQSDDGIFGDYSYMIPSVTAIGVSLLAMDNLIIVGEYQTRNYSELKDKSSYLNESDYNDGDVQRFGFEYFPLPWLILRGGGFRESAFIFNDNSGDPHYLRGITAGIGTSYKNIRMDLALEYFEYSYHQRLSESYRPKIESSQLEMGVTVGYSF